MLSPFASFYVSTSGNYKMEINKNLAHWNNQFLRAHTHIYLTTRESDRVISTNPHSMCWMTDSQENLHYSGNVLSINCLPFLESVHIKHGSWQEWFCHSWRDSTIISLSFLPAQISGRTSWGTSTSCYTQHDHQRVAKILPQFWLLNESCLCHNQNTISTEV